MSVPTRLHIPTPRSRWTDGVVYGLEDPLLDAQILNRTLRDWRLDQEIKAASAGPLSGPALLVGDDIWISDRMLRDFLRAAASSTTPVRLVRAADGPGRYADPLVRLPRNDTGQILFDVWYLPAGYTTDLAQEVTLPEDLDLLHEGMDVVTKTFDVEATVDPEATGVSQQSFSIAPVAVAPIAHWVELHRANLLALGANATQAGPVRGALTLLWAALRAMSLNPYKVLAKLNRCGRGCRIHPRAVVEGCTLGDNVKVDAGAVLRGCFIGDGVDIGANCVAEFSIIGDGARLTRMGMANLCVIYPKANLGGIMQLGFAGRSATTKLYSVGTDMQLDKPVRVKTPDGLRAVEGGYQGVCFGHGVFVASGVWIAPGRVISTKRRLLRPVDSVVTK